MIPKFRAWDKEHNEMLYPDDVDKIYFEITVDGIVTYDMRYILPYDDIPPYLDTVIMQSTGITDKNGKEIFEGDIVRAEHENFSMDEVPPEYKPYIGFIKYIKTGYSIITKDTYHPCLSNIRITNIEVIGNVHEHPHLLNTKEEN